MEHIAFKHKHYTSLDTLRIISFVFSQLSIRIFEFLQFPPLCSSCIWYHCCCCSFRLFLLKRMWIWKRVALCSSKELLCLILPFANGPFLFCVRICTRYYFRTCYCFCCCISTDIVPTLSLLSQYGVLSGLDEISWANVREL